MKRVLTIAVLLGHDSFMIYTEPIVLTGGRQRDHAAVDRSVKVALASSPGPARHVADLLLIVLLLSWIFYTVMTRTSPVR